MRKQPYGATKNSTNKDRNNNKEQQRLTITAANSKSRFIDYNNAADNTSLSSLATHSNFEGESARQLAVLSCLKDFYSLLPAGGVVGLVRSVPTR